MYREYNGQWRQLDAGKICTENTMVNEGNYTLYKYVQRIQWSMKAISRCKNMYREYNGQWRQLDAEKICTENTMVNEGN